MSLWQDGLRRQPEKKRHLRQDFLSTDGWEPRELPDTTLTAGLRVVAARGGHGEARDFQGAYRALREVNHANAVSVGVGDE